MKSDEVILGFAARLASWRAILILLHTWATCKPWQREDFNQYSTTLAACLNHLNQNVWKSAGGAAPESGEVGKRRRKRHFADVDGPGANLEPELGPHGPTLKKQVLKGCDWLDLRLGLQPAYFDDSTQDFEWARERRARHQDSSSRESSLEICFSQPRVGTKFSGSPSNSDLDACEFFSEAMDPEGLPSSIGKVADTARSSSTSSAATVPGWWSLFCLGNGK